MLFLTFISIALTALLGSCGPNSSLSSDRIDIDSVKVAKAYLADTGHQNELGGIWLERRSSKIKALANAELLDSTATEELEISEEELKWIKDPSRSFDVFGEPVLEQVGAEAIVKYSQNKSGYKKPTYVEFRIDELADNLAKVRKDAMSHTMKLSQYKVRAYLSAPIINGQVKDSPYYASVLFAMAKPDGKQYTDRLNLLFDVGSACPPDCETGRLDNDSHANSKKGALLVAKKVPDSKHIDSCLKFGAQTSQQGTCEK